MEIYICIKLGNRAEVGLSGSGLHIVQFGLTVDMLSFIKVGWVRDCVIARPRVAALVAALLHQE